MIGLRSWQHLVILVLVAAMLSGCGSPPSSDSSDTAIRVNDVTISLEDFNEQIKLQAYSDPEMTLTREARQEFVNYLIRKELMIQEAIRLKMERRKEFVKTIETYWESTLIRGLLDQKTDEFRKKILVTEDELRTFYDQQKDNFDEPFDAVKDQIQNILESKKIEAAMESWTRQLQADADISVSPALTSKTQ